MVFSTSNPPWNKGKKGYKLNRGGPSYYQKNREKLIPLIVEKKRKKKEKIAGRPKPDNCEVCGNGRTKICFDHDHATGEFRGWICHNCNWALGLLKDNIKTIKALAQYLEEHQIEQIKKAQLIKSPIQQPNL